MSSHTITATSHYDTPATEHYMTVCDHCGDEVPESQTYVTANCEVICDWTDAPVPTDSCRDYLTDEEVR